MEPAPFTGPPPSTTPATPPMSLAARLSNLFVTPGEVFDTVKNSPSTLTNWLVPTLLMAVIGAISTCIILSQPAILQGIHEQQQKAIDEKVAAGKMSQKDADKALEMIEEFSGPTMMKISGSIAVVTASFAGVFWWAFLLWLIGRWFLKTKVGFMKMVELAGLASMITILETVIKTLLVILLSNPMASISPALFLRDADPNSKLFMLLGVLNPMTFWVLAVRSIGLGKFAGVPWTRAAVGVFVVWLVLTGIFIGLAIAVQAAFVK